MIPWFLAVASAQEAPPAPIEPAPIEAPPPARPGGPGPEVSAGPPAPADPADPPPRLDREEERERSVSPLGDRLPSLAPRGPVPAIGLALAAIVGSAAASGARSASAGLLPSGLLPRLLRWLEVGCRGAVVTAGLGVGLALVPDSLAPAVPWIGVAFALAVGWSVRDALPDLVAWLSLTAEGRIRPGVWVRGEGFEGTVDALRPRVTWLIDARGHHAAIPNRAVVGLPLRTDRSRHPEIEIAIHLPEISPALARAALHEATLLSPWIAPRGAPEIGCDPTAPERWTVRIRLLDLRFRDRFVGSLPERVREVLDVQLQR